MKKYLCLLLIVLMSFSLVLVSCSPEAKTEEKKEETFTNDNATKVGEDVGTVGAVVASAVKTLDFKNQPCTFSVDIASTTDKNLELVSNTVAPSSFTNLSFREVESSSTIGYHEIKLTFDVGNVVKEGLSKMEYKLSDTESFDKTFTKASDEEIAKFKASQLYKDFNKLLTLYSSSNEFHFSGEVLTKLMSEIKDCAPDVTVEILIGENGANGKLTLTAHFVATDDSITVTVKEAVLKSSKGIELFSTSGAEFSVTFDDDFDIVFEADDSFDFKSISGGVTVTVKKCTVLALLKTKSFDIGGSVKYNFTTKKLESALTVKGEKLDAGFSVKAELKDKDSAVASLVNGLEVTKLSYDGTAFDTESVNTVLKTRREIIIKALKGYLDGSAISSLTTTLK